MPRNNTIEAVSIYVPHKNQLHALGYGSHLALLSVLTELIYTTIWLQITLSTFFLKSFCDTCFLFIA